MRNTNPMSWLNCPRTSSTPSIVVFHDSRVVPSPSRGSGPSWSSNAINLRTSVRHCANPQLAASATIDSWIPPIAWTTRGLLTASNTRTCSHDNSPAAHAASISGQFRSTTPTRTRSRVGTGSVPASRAIQVPVRNPCSTSQTCRASSSALTWALAASNRLTARSSSTPAELRSSSNTAVTSAPASPWANVASREIVS